MLTRLLTVQMKLKAANRASKYLTGTQEKKHSSRIYVLHQWKQEKLPWRFKKLKTFPCGPGTRM